MPQIKDEILLGLGGLDWDRDERFLSNGDSDYRLNIRPNAYGTELSLTNLEGNTKYTHSFSHGGDYASAVYTCIGDCYDPVRDSVYLFIYSSLGNSSILRFNFSDNSFDKICFDHTGLGFDLKYPLSDAYMIGDWLHWNPRTSSPRSINVQWAYYDWVSYTPFTGEMRDVGDYVRYFNKVYETLVATSVADVFNTDLFRFVDYCYEDTYPVNGNDLDSSVTSSVYFRYRDFYNIPTLLNTPVVAEIETDSAYEYNNIRGRRFQFCYRHYVKDQGYTITSPFTDIIAAPSSETPLGEVVGDISAYNKITISYPIQYGDGHGTLDYWYDHDTLFEFIEILFREGPDDIWKVAERINWGDAVTNFSFPLNSTEFFNDRAYEVVDTAMIEKQFNALPVLADAQWTLDGERSAYGAVTEGYNASFDLDVTLTVGETELPLSLTPSTLEATHTIGIGWNSNTNEYRFYTDTISNSGSAADEVLQVTVDGVTYYHTLTATDVSSATNYAGAITSLLYQADIVANVITGPVVEWYDTRYITADEVFRYAAATYSGKSYKVGSFKNGAWHPFCLFYWDDAGRRTEPITDDSLRVYVDTLPEALTASTDSTNYQRHITWSIDHKPPEYASEWGFGYAGNQTIDKFWQYNVKEITINETRGNGTDDWTRIDISPLQRLADDTDTSLDHYFPNSVIEAYSWEDGDRLRFITQEVAAPDHYDDLRVAATNDDYEILEFDDTNHYIYIDELTSAATTPATVIVEIYRPKKQTGTTTFYEFGQRHKVYTDSGALYHRGETQDQDSTNPAEGQFNRGDVWVVTRLFSLEAIATANEPVFVESYSWSDFSDTEGWGKGKTGSYTGIGQSKVNNIRYSNRYSPNTQSSGLSTFDFLDYKEMSSDHGFITAMRQVGNTLKVYFERNSASVMVNKTQFYSADGVSQVLKSDQVLGDAAYSNYHYGTIFPESVCLKDRTVFFFDVYRDAYLQDSANGVIPISDYRMRRYFKEKSATILSTGINNVRVKAIYDYDFDTLVVLFDIEEDTDENNCIMFHEPSNRWTSFMSCEVDDFQEGPIFDLTSPEYLGTTPNLWLAGSFSYGQYSTSVFAAETDSDTFDMSFTGTNEIYLTAGAEISLDAYISSNEASITNVLYMVITSPDGTTTEPMSTHVGSGNKYLYTHTATQNGYFHVTFRINGVVNVIKDDYSTVTWNAEYTQNIKPVFGNGVSNVVSYINEDVWLHNSNATRNNLWGSQEDSVVRVVSAMQPNVVKEFLAMAIHSNARWDVTNITIPATINYPDGMESLIPEGHFEEDEGVLRSDYLCNMKTTSSVATVPDLLNGDNLRGYIISHDLTSDDTTEIYLFKVDVSSNISKQ